MKTTDGYLPPFLIRIARSNSCKKDPFIIRMAHYYRNVLPTEILQEILQQPDVTVARSRLASGSRSAAFYTRLSPETKATLKNTIGLDLNSVEDIPMRWIQGDSAAHVDVGRAHFDTTYVLYVSDATGDFIVDGTTYPIEQGAAVVFSEGSRHETKATSDEPRLLLGPMSDGGFAVGAPVYYYLTLADALAYSFAIGFSNDYTVDTVDGYSSWRIASNSTGTSSQLAVYVTGQTLNNDGSYYLYPALPCFLEGTTVLCKVDEKERYVPIQDIKPGTLVRTAEEGFKPVGRIGHSPFANSGTTERSEMRLYRCSKEKYIELGEDLYLTGSHSILVNKLTDVQREKTIQCAGEIFVTEKKYRLMAHIDERAEPWSKAGTYTVWHLAIADTDRMRNYGIYVNGGLLVESASIRFLEDKSNMTLV